MIYFQKQGMFSKINGFRHYLDTIMESCVKYSCSAEFVKQLVAMKFRPPVAKLLHIIAEQSLMGVFTWQITSGMYCQSFYIIQRRTRCLLFVYLVQETHLK